MSSSKITCLYICMYMYLFIFLYVLMVSVSVLNDISGMILVIGNGRVAVYCETFERGNTLSNLMSV